MGLPFPRLQQTCPRVPVSGTGAHARLGTKEAGREAPGPPVLGQRGLAEPPGLTSPPAPLLADVRGSGPLPCCSYRLRPLIPLGRDLLLKPSLCSAPGVGELRGSLLWPRLCSPGPVAESGRAFSHRQLRESRNGPVCEPTGSCRALRERLPREAEPPDCGRGASALTVRGLQMPPRLSILPISLVSPEAQDLGPPQA